MGGGGGGVFEQYKLTLMLGKAFVGDYSFKMSRVVIHHLQHCGLVLARSSWQIIFNSLRLRESPDGLTISTSKSPQPSPQTH